MFARGPLAILLALLMVAAPVMSVTGPNGSAQDIPGDGDGNAIALASNPTVGFQAGRLVAGSDDPGSRATFNPNLNTWWIWDNDGLQIRTGGADISANCPPSGSLTNQCRSHVVDVAISADGTRIVVAAREHNSDNSRLVFISAAQGAVHREEINRRVLSVELTPDGTKAVASFLHTSLPSDLGQIRGYTWSTGNAVAPAWTKNSNNDGVNNPVTQLAISDSGQVAAGGGSEHYRMVSWGGAVIKNGGLAANVAAVDFASQSTNWWSVAGYADGGVALYQGNGQLPQLDIKPSNSAQNAVGITSDGMHFFSGGADGRLRQFVNRILDESATQTQVVNIGPLNGAIRDMAVSADDRYLAVAAGNGVYLYRILPTGIVEVWRDVRASAATDVDISSDGAHVAGLFGASTIVRYVPSYSILVDAPSAPVAVSPGTSNIIDVTYTNNGNRYADVSVEVQKPSGWDDPTVTPAQFGLAPGASRLVRLDVQVPDLHPAGPLSIDVRHSATGSVPSNTAVDLDVRTVRFWDLEVASGSSGNQAIEAGDSVVYNLTASNVGNAEDTTDVIVEVDIEGWSVAADPASLTLAAGQTAQVNLTLTAPAGAANLETARVDVSLAADPVASLDLTATVGARFGVSASASAVGGTGVVAGEVKQVRVSVTNQGNAPDSYLVTPGSLPIGWSAQATNGQSPIRIENVEPGTTVDVLIDVSTAAFALEGNYQVPFGVSSIGDASKTTTAQVLLGVQEPDDGGDGDGDGDNGTPAPGLLLLIVALGIALVARRRSR